MSFDLDLLKLSEEELAKAGITDLESDSEESNSEVISDDVFRKMIARAAKYELRVFLYNEFFRPFLVREKKKVSIAQLKVMFKLMTLDSDRDRLLVEFFPKIFVPENLSLLKDEYGFRSYAEVIDTLKVVYPKEFKIIEEFKRGKRKRSEIAKVMNQHHKPSKKKDGLIVTVVTAIVKFLIRTFNIEL